MRLDTFVDTHMHERERQVLDGHTELGLLKAIKKKVPGKEKKEGRGKIQVLDTLGRGCMTHGVSACVSVDFDF